MIQYLQAIRTWWHRIMIWLVDIIPGSTQGSRRRRLFTVAMITWSAVIAFDHIVGAKIFNLWQAYALLIFSLIYFAVVVIAVFFKSNRDFVIEPVRLSIDTLVSMIACTLTFALIYRFYGITDTGSCDSVTSALASDSLYFSSVTFSTLGYGDFKPCSYSRFFAASQAILGNLHLGLIVGTAFLLAARASVDTKDLAARASVDATDSKI